MNKKIFRRISITAVISLALLTVVQCMWIYNLYLDQKVDFNHRVETAAYKSMYGAFALNATQEDEVQQINIDLSTFAIYFETNLGELEIEQPYIAEVINMDADRVMMRYNSSPDDENTSGSAGSLLSEGTFQNAHTFQMAIDADNMFNLRISISFPLAQFFKSIWLLLATSIMIVVLLSLVMIWMVNVLFTQKSLEEMRRDFTHNMTHELKTPISVASAAVDALRNFSADSNPERRARYLQMTDAALKQLSAMVEKILAVAVEGRQAKLNKEKINLARLLNEAANETNLAANETQLNTNSNIGSNSNSSNNSSNSSINNSSSSNSNNSNNSSSNSSINNSSSSNSNNSSNNNSSNNNSSNSSNSINSSNSSGSSADVSVGVKCEENIFIEADRFHFKNVIATLLDNAVKYAPDGDGRKIEITVSAERRGDEVVIEVKDNGCGIAKEHLPHIFEKFYRVPKGDIHQVRGYGLGLSYAQKIVVQHGGRISAESRLGKGTTITIVLYK